MPDGDREIADGPAQKLPTAKAGAVQSPTNAEGAT